MVAKRADAETQIFSLDATPSGAAGEGFLHAAVE
jgi:hypothetical protein